MPCRVAKFDVFFYKKKNPLALLCGMDWSRDAISR